MDRRAVLLGFSTLFAATAAATLTRPAQALPLIDQLRALDAQPSPATPAVVDGAEAADARASVEQVQWRRRVYYRRAYYRPRYVYRRRWYGPRYVYRRPVYWGPRRRCRWIRTWRGWARRCWW